MKMIVFESLLLKGKKKNVSILFFKTAAGVDKGMSIQHQLPPVLLSVNPNDVLRGNNTRLGEYLAAITATLTSLHSKVVGTSDTRRRRLFHALSWLVKRTRHTTLQRGYNALQEHAFQQRQKKTLTVVDGAVEKCGRIAWLEGEYTKVSIALQDILGLLSREREDKKVIQDSVERLANVMNDSQLQMQQFSNEIETYFGRSAETRRKRPIAHLLWSNNLKYTLRSYFYKLLNNRNISRKHLIRKRHIRGLLQSTARSLLSKKLKLWMLWLQHRVHKKIQRRSTCAILTKKTNIRILKKHYDLLMEASKIATAYRKNRKLSEARLRKLRYLEHTTENRFVRQYYNLLEQNVLNSKRILFDEMQNQFNNLHGDLHLLVDKASDIENDIKNLRQKSYKIRSLTIHVVNTNADNAKKSLLDRYYRDWSLFASLIKKNKIRNRGLRYLMQRTFSLEQFEIFKDAFGLWKKFSFLKRSRTEDRISTSNKLLRKTTLRLLEKTYSKIELNYQIGKKILKQNRAMQYLARKTLKCTLNRSYDKLMRFFLMKNRLIREQEILGTDFNRVMVIVEGLVEQTSLLKASGKRHKDRLLHVQLTILIDKNNRRLLQEFYNRMRDKAVAQMTWRLKFISVIRMLDTNRRKFADRIMNKLISFRNEKIEMRKYQRKTKSKLATLRALNLNRHRLSVWERWCPTSKGQYSSKSKKIIRKLASNGTLLVLRKNAAHNLLQKYFWKLLYNQKNRRRILNRQRAVSHLLRRSKTLSLRRRFADWSRLVLTSGMVKEPKQKVFDDRLLSELKDRILSTERNNISLRDKLISLENTISEMMRTKPRALSPPPPEVDSIKESDVNHLLRELEGRIRSELNGIRDSLGKLEDLREQDGMRTSSLETEVAIIQRQMQNSTSVLNKLIDRLMKVDEQIERIDIASKATAPANRQRSVSPTRVVRRHSIPSSHLSLSKASPVMPAAPPPDRKGPSVFGSYNQQMLSSADVRSDTNFSLPVAVNSTVPAISVFEQGRQPTSNSATLPVRGMPPSRRSQEIIANIKVNSNVDNNNSGINMYPLTSTAGNSVFERSESGLSKDQPQPPRRRSWV